MKNKKIKHPNKKEQDDMKTRIGQFIKGQDELAKKLQLNMALCINFPFRRTMPFFSRLAIKLLKSQGGIVDMRFIDLKK
jgi:hypothetical protein